MVALINGLAAGSSILSNNSTSPVSSVMFAVPLSSNFPRSELAFRYRLHCRGFSRPRIINAGASITMNDGATPVRDVSIQSSFLNTPTEDFSCFDYCFFFFCLSSSLEDHYSLDLTFILNTKNHSSYSRILGQWNCRSFQLSDRLFFFHCPFHCRSFMQVKL